MHRSGLWIVTLALLALPLSAQPRPEPACDKVVIGSATDLKVAEQRLFDELSGLGQDSIPAPLPATYLPSCLDCTPTTPCETECGWEPGKGGPVTCGEYGMNCQG
jgi:hypothetical protein